MLPASPLLNFRGICQWIRQSYWGVHNRNPFFLFSALSMFIGFRVVLGALNYAPSDWKTLLALVVTLNVYEAMIIALALFLIVKRGLRRDGWILLGIEALFLVDLTNLNAELFTAQPRLGAAVNAICFALAMVKVGVVVRVLRLRLTSGTWFYIAAQLALLFALPGIFRLMRSPAASVSAMQIYGMWWMVALLIAGGSMLVKRVRSESPMAALPWRLYVVVPLVSLLVHLLGENRVYWVHFHPANITPLLAAAAFVLQRSRYRWHALALPGTMALLTLGVLLSIPTHTYQHDLSAHLHQLMLTPLRFSLLVAAGLSMYAAYRCNSSFAACMSVAYTICLCFGATPGQMLSNGLRASRRAMEFAMDLIPDTALQWGCTAIVVSFLLLGVGAMFSLRRPHVALEST